jgi:DNA-binding response OmpR family regulator
MPPEKPIIFVVDDSPTTLQFVHLVLSENGFMVTPFNNPMSMANELARSRPAMILVDVGMPALDGDKLIREIRGRRNVQGTLILLHSAKALHELEALAEACGADGYIKKSLDPDVLVASVRQYLDAAGATP